MLHMLWEILDIRCSIKGDLLDRRNDLFDKFKFALEELKTIPKRATAGTAHSYRGEGQVHYSLIPWVELLLNS